jgi:hypothetical protein
MSKIEADLTIDERQVFESLWKRTKLSQVVKLEEAVTEQTLLFIQTKDEGGRTRIKEGLMLLKEQIHSLRSEGQPAILSSLPSTDQERAFVAFCMALNREIQKDVVDEFNFEMSWWNSGSTGSAQKLWVRDCYRSLFDDCLQCKEDGRMKFVFEGTPGTGKSGFGLYCVIRFVRAGHLVWYRYKTHAPILFVGSDDAKKTV